MPKRNRPDRPVPPPPPVPPENPPPDGPPEQLIISLISLDESVLRECQGGEDVTIQLDTIPISVTTLIGVRIGDAREEDYSNLRRIRSTRGYILKIVLDEMQCLVEVR